MNANHLFKTIVIFGALTITGTCLIVLAQASTEAKVHASLPLVGTALFAAALTYFLVQTAHLESGYRKAKLPISPISRTIVLFVALTIAGIALIDLGLNSSVEIVKATLPLVGTALFAGSLGFFLVEGGQLQTK